MKTSDISSKKRNKLMVINIICLFLFISCKQGKPDPVKSDDTPNAIKNTEPLCWKDFRYGELPPVGAYDAIDSLVKKWNLCYERIEAGCVVTDSIENLKKQYESSNKRYFKSLENQLGKDWKQHFDKELQTLDSINWIRIKHETDSINR